MSGMEARDTTERDPLFVRCQNLLGPNVGPATKTPTIFAIFRLQPYHFSDAVNRLVSRDYLHVTWKA